LSEIILLKNIFGIDNKYLPIGYENNLIPQTKNPVNKRGLLMSGR
jgi:hypothetical protein